jgi:hypothetical protein
MSTLLDALAAAVLLDTARTLARRLRLRWGHR